MIETPHWQFDLEVKPEGWRFPTGASWIAGWIWSPQQRLLTDLRCWIDGRPFLGVWGLPKPGLDERFLHRPGPPYLGFTLLVQPHAGASLLRLEVRDQTNQWTEIYRAAITTAADSPAPASPTLPALLPDSIAPLLRLYGRRPQVPLAALADEVVSSRLGEPLNCLPVPPFHGALEEPRESGWIRFGRLSITGWLAHRQQKITRITAMVDPLTEGALLHGIKRTDVDGVFADLPGRENSAFVGHVDLPADLSTPALLKIFAELENREKHLVFAQRFVPRVIAGSETALPPLSRLSFAKASWALRGAARRHGLPLGGWKDLRPALPRAWSAYAAEAPPKSGAIHLAAPLPPPPPGQGSRRILVVTHNLNYEGAPWFIFELALHLSKQAGLKVDIVSPQAGPMRETFTQAGLPVSVVDIAGAWQAADEAAFHAAVNRAGIDWAGYDLVIANTMVTFWAIHAAARAGVPTLLYVHESAAIRRFFEPLMAPALFPVVEHAFRLATRVVFTADSSRRVFAYLGDRHNFCLLPSWVEASRVDAYAAETDPAALRAKHGFDADEVLVINIGSVCERKGQHVFIQAVALLKAELAHTYPGKKIRFVMVGARAGLYLETLREEIRRLGLEDITRFIGETGNIFDFYALADVFVCSSFEESFPRVILESAAFRRLIVTTNVNGIAEMIGPEEAWLVPPGERYRMAEAVKLALAAHFANDRSRAERARAVVTQKYRESRSLPQHAALAQAAAAQR
jgi:glycosyltransferase involved in cell wall biosynthesis